MDIVILLVGFSIGLVLLVKGADEMVGSAVQIALKFKLPSSIIGATFIGLVLLPLNFLQVLGLH